MDRNSRFFTVFLILFLLLPTIFAQSSSSSGNTGLTPEQRAYFDNQNQKVIAQINAKIDQTVVKVENDLEKSTQDMREQVKGDVEELIQGTIKAVAIGIAGVVIITLAVFKVIDLRVTSTKNLKKYEKQLSEQTAELNKILIDNKRKMEELKNYRQQLVNWQQQLKNAEQNLSKGIQPQQISSINNIPLPPETSPVKKEKKKFSWKTLIIIFLILVIIGILVAVYLKVI